MNHLLPESHRKDHELWPFSATIQIVNRATGKAVAEVPKPYAPISEDEWREVFAKALKGVR